MPYRLRRLLLLLAAFSAMPLSWWLSWWSSPVAPLRPAHPFFAAPPARALVWAHQGASREAPPNTLPAFDRALSLGADVLETDLRLTADGVVVLFHDDSVDARTNGTGAVSALSAETVLALDAGDGFLDEQGEDWSRKTHVPTLQAFLERYAPVPGLRFSLELKSSDVRLSSELWRLLEEYQVADRVVVPSFSSAALSHFRALGGGRVATLLGTTEALEMLLLFHAGLGDRWESPADGFATFLSLGPVHADSPALVGWLSQQHVPVTFMTVNDASEMRRLLAMGARGIITDLPGLAVEVVREQPESP